ncbi:MAG: cobalt-zinc-cadmium resistance protein, partial [Hyphomonas sp.]|uniref:efflux RND transporter permease subunit n=1 Tax=unclassified Hyphomonas TaxID=2630699 RepID=UPI000B6DFEB4
MQIAVVSDRSIIFQQRAELLVKNGIFGLILVVVILALFLDIRLAFWVSMGIPISYMGAFLLLSMTDFSINMVSMFAFIIALGIVVDDAVVVGENIYHKRERGMKPLAASVVGAREVAIPVFVSVLTNIVAFLPMFFMPGFMGKIFAIVPLIVVCTFTLSFIESLFILPAHLTFKESRKIKNPVLLSIINFQKGFNRKFNNFVSNIYGPFLKKTISLRYVSLSAFTFVLIVMSGFAVSGRLPVVFFAPPPADYAYAKATLKVGSPEDKVIAVEKKLINAIEKVIAENGGDTLGTGVYSEINENEVSIRAYLHEAHIRPIDTPVVTNLWRKEVGTIPGLESLVFQADRGGPGSGAGITIELSHDDTEILERAAVSLANTLNEFPNVQDVDDGTSQGK